MSRKTPKKAPSGHKQPGSKTGQNQAANPDKNRHAITPTSDKTQGSPTHTSDKKTQEQMNADLEQQYKETLTERD